MLPFLKHEKEVSAAVPAQTVRREHDEDGDFDYLESCAEELLHAIETKNKKLLAGAIKAMFELCDAEPHVEGSHE